MWSNCDRQTQEFAVSQVAIPAVNLSPSDQESGPLSSAPPQPAVPLTARFKAAANDSDLVDPINDPELTQTELYAADAIEIFNDVPLGHDTADKRARALTWNYAYGDLTIGNGAGSVTAKSKEEQDAEAREEEAEAAWEDMKAQAEHLREWDEAIHTVGDRSFSGWELEEDARWFKSAEHVAAFQAKLVADGATEQEARRRAEKLKEWDELMEKVRRGKATPDEQQRYAQFQKDREFGEDLKTRDDLRVEWRRAPRAAEVGNVADVQSDTNVFSANAGPQALSAAPVAESLRSAPNIRATFNAEAPKLVADAGPGQPVAAPLVASGPAMNAFI